MTVDVSSAIDVARPVGVVAAYAIDPDNRGEPAGFSTLYAPFLAPAMRRANRRDLAKLKAILEARPADLDR